MSDYTQKHGLMVHSQLVSLLTDEIMPGLDRDAEKIWSGFSELVAELAPVNKALLQQRDAMQAQIDHWHRKNPGGLNDMAAYKAFLSQIGYLVKEGADFAIQTQNTDDEIAHIAGPQLVVPVNNARFALNAANARWGSLYDALYGTDAISEDNGCERAGAYNEKRGWQVIAWAADFLDRSAPLADAKHRDVTEYSVSDTNPALLVAKLSDGRSCGLQNPGQFIGYRGAQSAPDAIVVKNNGLHVELQIDRSHPIGRDNPSGVKDVWLEAAVSTIMDCEDSVAAIDARDKALVYRNWLGLMKGDLTETFDKGGKTMTRCLNEDRSCTAADGSEITLQGRSLLLVRNVGHLMTSNAILDKDGNEVPEGFYGCAVYHAVCDARF